MLQWSELGTAAHKDIGKSNKISKHTLWGNFVSDWWQLSDFEGI